MDLSGAMTAVEQAALGLAHPQHRASSEATLLEFRRSPHALPACRHILEHSASAEAQFQAAATMRDAALRWLSTWVEAQLALLVRWAAGDSSGLERWERARALGVHQEAPERILLGRHLRELVPPGPDMGRVLDAVYAQQLDGKVTGLEQALQAARRLVDAAG